MIKNKINHNSLSEIAYKKIKVLILNNVLKPGEKIVQEKMAMSLGISKIPLIQSLTRLSNEGLLVKIQRKGFCVREFSSEEINNIFEIREALESLSVSKLLKERSPKVVKKVKEFLKDFEYYYKNNDFKNYYDTDVKFHYFLIKSSKNTLLYDIFDKFNLLLIGYIKGFVLELGESYNQHKDLINAIIENDCGKALMFINKHVEAVREKMNSTGQAGTTRDSLNDFKMFEDPKG